MAVTIQAAALAEALHVKQALASRLLPVASRVVTDYAPRAPTVLQNEAVIRFAGYLADAGSGAATALTVDDLRLELVTNHAPAFRNSGAEALLTRHKVRRAGAI